MSDNMQVLTIEKTETCPWCGSSMVSDHVTSIAMGFGCGGLPRARRGKYNVCADCGVTFEAGDRLLIIVGKRYLLHELHWGADQLAGKLVTGPWGSALALGELPGDRIVLTRDDVGYDVQAHPIDHIEEIAAAVRARGPS